MRKKTIKLGLNLITAGIVLLILATFFHENVAAVFSLSTTVEARFVYISLFWGSAAGCIGIVVAAIGILRSEKYHDQVYITPSLIVLAAVIMLFFFLLFSSFQNPAHPRLHPGETIVI